MFKKGARFHDRTYHHRAVSPTHFVVDIPDPSSITDLTFFLLPQSPLSRPDQAAVLYFAVGSSGSTTAPHWQLLGSVDLSKPSALLRTSWPTNEDVCGQPGIQLGVALESLASVQNLGLEHSGVAERQNFALKIAQDLFDFMSSFNTSSNQDMMLVPTNLLNRWMDRFTQKYKRDPNFMMKKST